MSDTAANCGTDAAYSHAKFSKWNKLVEHLAQKQVSYVKGADGNVLLTSDLPTRNNQRWVTRHKANLVAAVRGGLITFEDACKRYNLSVEEFLEWQRTYDRFGQPGLRATRIQQYRQR